MTDRELLELAAKAADIDYEPHKPHVWPWNPLDNDGDALRLAVALDISVSPGEALARSRWWVRPQLIKQASVSEKHRGDPQGAVRRSIVRAAAEIGKGMK